MKKIKITAAYCVQLDKVVDIEEAHAASMERNGEKLDFFCSSVECRLQEVPIIGVNHNVPLSEHKKAMHFRENTYYKHHENCEWVLANEYAFYEGTHQGETPEEADIRRKLYTSLKNDYLISVYDPYDPNIGVNSDDPTHTVIDHKPQNSGVKSHQDRCTEAIEKVRKTSSFYKLVRCHHELSEAFEVDEFRQFPLRVAGVQTSWYDYFKVFTYVWNQPDFNGIMYGYISKNIKSYGKGYSIYMGAKINERSVSIYISSEQITNYRSRRELIDVLENANKFDKINAYFIPDAIELVTTPSGKEVYQIRIADLRNLRLVGTVK
ncbi:hypothetical protein [Neisseria sp. Ec49-e6-T10]|uniref:hypothetical protein n=1 Tax=Neisseria sp. Ec49-e6-T10 TaxID=3140744 RepID=UPI003EC07F50